jgi:hypothetical protein
MNVVNEVKRVAIPREVAEAIEWFRNQGGDNGSIVSIGIGATDRGVLGEIIRGFAMRNCDVFLSAIINGYSVEKSAEELAQEQDREQLRLIRHRYNMLRCRGIIPSYTMCIADYRFLLDKIEGVNA